jgi:hypothetical protein
MTGAAPGSERATRRVLWRNTILGSVLCAAAPAIAGSVTGSAVTALAAGISGVCCMAAGMIMGATI